MFLAMVVDSVLPDPLTEAVTAVLRPAGITHQAHGYGAPMWAAEVSAADPEAVAMIGPYRSADVAEAVEATAPAGLALIAPGATWAGVTRDDEPGCDEAARHERTVLRMVARDTEVAARIAADVRAAGRRALVVAGGHDYGRQPEGQLRLVGLPRAERPEDADLVVLCGLAGSNEIERAAALAPLPVIAFDGVQGGDLGAGRDVCLALPIAPAEGVVVGDVLFFVEPVRAAARLVAGAGAGGGGDRAAVLAAMRAAGRFDAHGDPVGARVWLWRADDRWGLPPERALPPA